MLDICHLLRFTQSFQPALIHLEIYDVFQCLHLDAET